MKINLLGIAYDEKSSFLKGPALAPPIIRQTMYSPAYNFTAENGLDIEKDISIIDKGDISIQKYTELKIKLAQLITDKTPSIFLGGDHSITYPIIDILHQLHGAFDILHFDAHSDLYHEFEGDPFSHACPFARIMENNLASRLVQVGIRTLNQHQAEQAEKFGVEIIQMNEIEKLSTIQFHNPLYISIDIDGFDPAYAPGVSHQEAGGLVPRQVINFLQKLKVPIIGADIVEFNPTRDISGLTASLSSKLLKELLAIIAKSHSNN